jgi:hypothetical protein
VDILARRKNLCKDTDKPRAEFRCGKVCLQYRALRFFGNFDENLAGKKVVGKNATRNMPLKHFPYSVACVGFLQLAKVCHLSAPEDLDALVDKRFKKTRQGKSGSVDVGNTYLPAKPLAPPYACQI